MKETILAFSPARYSGNRVAETIIPNERKIERAEIYIWKGAGFSPEEFARGITKLVFGDIDGERKIVRLYVSDGKSDELDESQKNYESLLVFDRGVFGKVEDYELKRFSRRLKFNISKRRFCEGFYWTNLN